MHVWLIVTLQNAVFKISQTIILGLYNNNKSKNIRVCVAYLAYDNGLKCNHLEILKNHNAHTQKHDS